MRLIETARLVLEPLTAAHAEAMLEVLADSSIYRYLDYPPPPSLEHLRCIYSRLEGRESPDGTQLWLNWIIRPPGESPLGYVQATVFSPRTAWIAYVLASKYWGHGYAFEAVRAMLSELAGAYLVERFLATVEAENRRSIYLLERLGFRRAMGEEAEEERLSPTEQLFIR